MKRRADSETVLVVEDESRVAELISRLLIKNGFQVASASDGESALTSIAHDQPNLILLDVGLPGIDGFEVCRRVKNDPATRLTPVVLLSGRYGRVDRIVGIEAGADDFLAKPFDFEELHARVRSLTDLKRYTDELESVESVIASLALTVEARDAFTDGHCERLSRYATALGTDMGLNDGQINILRRGGYLHDVGKIGIPDAVLLKTSRLTPAEYELMKRHTLIGELLCGNLKSLAPVRSIVRHHHERLDGSGYPDGLQGDAVPLLAQIVSIVDAFDAMTMSRPYRQAMSVAQAIAELGAEADRGGFSHTLVNRFIALVQRDFDGGIALDRRKRGLERSAIFAKLN